MKYQALFDLTMERGGVTLRVADYPETIIMPIKGFAVGAHIGDYGDVLLDAPADHIAKMFDAWVEAALIDAVEMGTEYIGTWVDDNRIVIDLVHVFSDKAYAMGYAHCSRQDAIYDLGSGKEIFIKRKGK